MAGITHKLTVNVPITMRIKYADEVTGEFGSQIRLKGTIEGVSTGPEDVKAVYVPLDCAADLIAAGAKRETNEKGAFYRPIAEGPWTVLKGQAPGAKCPETTLAHGIHAAPAGGPAAEQPPLGEPPEDAAPARAVAPSKVARDTELVEIFADCFKRVAALANLYNDKNPEGIQMTAETVGQLTATLYIARSRLVA